MNPNPAETYYELEIDSPIGAGLIHGSFATPNEAERRAEELMASGRACGVVIYACNRHIIRELN